MKELFKKLDELLATKGHEYVGKDVDTLANFSARANWLGVERKAVLFTDLSKHLDALRGWAMQNRTLTLEQAENRLIDTLVYTILLIALYRQEKE